MNTVSLSLWLPVSRPNFYNSIEDDWMDRGATEGDQVWCSSNRIKPPKPQASTVPSGSPEPSESGTSERPYTPLVLVGVLRRLLEVMPLSFGYGPEALCEMRGDKNTTRRRPVSALMTLDLQRPSRHAMDFWAEANDALVAARVNEVRLFVSENGAYAFTASYADGADRQDVYDALMAHIRQVFGGNYVVHPLPVEDKLKRHLDVGSMALKAYNGLEDNPRPDREPDADDDIIVSQPLGTLAFSQLNILAEGMWNDALSPAVFLEQHDFITTYLDGPESKEYLRSVADVIEALTTEVDARTTLGQIVVLYHFLTVSSHGSLLKLKSALESVRRRLLDEMMSSMHRQHRLVQLRFATNGHERRPELAVGATETQLKGYAALVAAKFPLIQGVKEAIRLARDHLDWVVERDGRPVLQPTVATQPEDVPEAVKKELSLQLTRLHGQIDHWEALLNDLKNNVDSLSRTMEHSWMEDLLYEEKQLRSDQEAMAEIERSRLSRPDAANPALSLFNLTQIVLAAFALVLTVNNDRLKTVGGPDVNYGAVLWSLWPAWSTILFILVLLLGRFLYRLHKHRTGEQATYPYEFTFRLNEKLNRQQFMTYMKSSHVDKLTAPTIKHRVRMRNRGFGRIEHISVDRSVVKIRQVITFRTGWAKYARFEAIGEVSIHKIARNTDHVLLQARFFGESPVPLKDGQLIDLLTVVLDHLLEKTSEASAPEEKAPQAAPQDDQKRAATIKPDVPVTEGKPTKRTLVEYSFFGAPSPGRPATRSKAQTSRAVVPTQHTPVG